MIRLAEIVRTRQDEILRSWSHEAQKAAAAKGLKAPELTNLITSYIPALADAGEELGRNSGRRRELLEAHFASRLRQGFQLSEIVEELNLLGRAIANTWTEAASSERPDDVEVQRLYNELHLAGAAVVEMFTHHMLEDEQTDKRYRRLLQTIVMEALQPGAPPFEERLKEVLQLVMEATETDTAALLLCQRQPLELHVVASVGAADEALERYAASAGPSSFAGQIAAHEEPIAVLDATTTDLEISDTLRKSGVRALLGIRLPLRDALAGIMYVGLMEKRAFSAREVRRLEYLAELLSVHLESAKLYAVLRQHVVALQSERELRERFVSVLAHDLRGPLSAARLGAERLVAHPESLDERSELGTKIVRNIDRTDRMIRDLLDTNRIRAGERLPLQITACDLGALAREVVEELVASHGKRFTLVAEESVTGFWSPDELRRALWNLAINAVKYGATGEPITVTVRKVDGRARLSVHNFGAPIAAEDQKNLFEPFTRTQSAQAGVQRGWGLGLTLVQGCTQAHGGNVTLSSSPGSGTTFTMELPLDARPFQATAAPHAAPRA